MLEVKIKKNSKSLIMTALAAAFLSACSVPGTYFSESDVQNGYQSNGKQQSFVVTELNSKWLDQHSKDTPYVYHIGPYDILNIIVWNHPELTTPTNQVSTPSENGILVDEEGYIFFPFAGKVKVSGLTLDQARIVIEQRLTEYIRDPQLSVRVADFRSQQVQILGEVVKPGLIPVTDKPLSVMEAISTVGGVNSFTANTQQIFMLSEQAGKIYIYWFDAQQPTSIIAANKFFLQNNVIVYVPPAGISAWSRVVNQILPLMSGASSAEGLATQ